MGALLTKEPSIPPNKQLIHSLRVKSLQDIKDCIEVINKEYSTHVNFTFKEFDDVFGGILNDCDPYFS